MAIDESTIQKPVAKPAEKPEAAKTAEKPAEKAQAAKTAEKPAEKAQAPEVPARPAEKAEGAAKKRKVAPKLSEEERKRLSREKQERLLRFAEKNKNLLLTGSKVLSIEKILVWEGNPQAEVIRRSGGTNQMYAGAVIRNNSDTPYTIVCDYGGLSKDYNDTFRLPDAEWAKVRKHLEENGKKVEDSSRTKRRFPCEAPESFSPKSVTIPARGTLVVSATTLAAMAAQPDTYGYYCGSENRDDWLFIGLRESKATVKHNSPMVIQLVSEKRSAKGKFSGYSTKSVQVRNLPRAVSEKIHPIAGIRGNGDSAEAFYDSETDDRQLFTVLDRIAKDRADTLRKGRSSDKGNVAKRVSGVHALNSLDAMRKAGENQAKLFQVLMKGASNK